MSSVGDHHVSRSEQRYMAALERVRIDEAAVKTVIELDDGGASKYHGTRHILIAAVIPIG